MKELTEYDQLLLGEKGIKVSKLQEQVAIFLAGVPPVNLVAPAHVGSGILSFSRDEAIQYVAIYQKKKTGWISLSLSLPQGLLPVCSSFSLPLSLILILRNRLLRRISRRAVM